MSFKTILEWNTGVPPRDGWYNTLIINDNDIPEVMTTKWDKDNGWDDPYKKIEGWSPFPLVCEFLGHTPNSTPGESTPEDKIVAMTEELLVTFEKHTTVDDSEIIKSVRDIVVAHIYYGGTHADK